MQTKQELKTYNVIWTERMSVNIEAENEEKALAKMWDSDYDEANVSSEIDGAIEAYEINLK